MDRTSLEKLRDYLRVLYDPKLIDRLIKGINPVQEVTLRLLDDAGKPVTRHVRMGFERVRSGGEISQILFRLEDITRQVEMDQELKQRKKMAKERSNLMLQIAVTEPQALLNLLDRLEELLVHVPDEVLHGSDHQACDAFFRKIHRAKGDAAVLELKAFVEAIHRTESALKAVRAPQASGAERDVLAQSIDELRELTASMRATITQLTALRQEASNQGWRDVGGSLAGELKKLCASLCDRHGKLAAIHAIADEARLPHQFLNGLRDILVRNSVVHGIEVPEVRKSRGKDPLGMIQWVVEWQDHEIEVIFQDDGNGIDEDRVRRRAQKLGLPCDTPEQVRQAIFAPGLSTAHATHEDAGRGVGMDVIAECVRNLGGSITCHSSPGEFCAFQMIFPLNSNELS